MRKRRVASAPSGTASITLTVGFGPNLRDSLKQLAATRKAASKASKPVFIQGIVDDSVVKLAAMLKSGADVAYLPQPRSSVGRTSFRISTHAHQIAAKASKDADVKLADFIRTAVSLYIRNHAHEIYAETSAPADRSRKSARRKV